MPGATMDWREEMLSPRWGKLVLAGCLVLAGLTQAACTGPAASLKSQPAQLLQWPNAPLPAKIQWVRTVADPAGAGISTGFWKSAWNLLVGGEKRHMIRPYGVLCDARERLIIADPGGGAIHLMDARENRYSIIEGGEGFKLRTPIGLTEDLQNHLYVTDSSAGEVYLLDLETLQLKPFPTPQLSRPTGIAYNAFNKQLYIVDTLADEVVVVSEGGKEVRRFGSLTFNHPTDIYIDKKGVVYVTDALNYNIQLFTPEGKAIGQIGTAGAELGRLNKPKGVAADSDGHIYINDAMHDAVQVFDAAGRFLLSFGSTGSENGEFWMPSGIYIDAQNYIFVADTYNRRVQIFRYLSEAIPPGPGTAQQGAK
jgi:DNA-binding beta-propeller fold protein YncE